VEIFESSNQKFKTALKNLILKNKILQDKIKYIKYSGKLIYSEFLKSNKTLEEINYMEENEFEIILKNYFILKFKSKFLKNKNEFKVKVSYFDKFKNVIDLLKENYNDLNCIDMDNIICYQHYHNKDFIIINGKNDYEKYIKDLNINKNEIIFFEHRDNLLLLSKNTKKELEKQIEMEFVHLGIGTGEIYTIKLFKQNTFLSLINKLKNEHPELNEINFNEIYIDDEGIKKYIIKNENDLNKKIENILEKGEEYSIFYITGDYIDSFTLQLLWANNNNQKYQIKVGKKELFHNAINKFIESNDIFEDNIITKIYSEKDHILNVNIERVTIRNVYIEEDIENTSSVRNKITDNYINEEFKNIIEIHNKYNYESFENLDIYENTKIYFETEINNYEKNIEYNKFEQHKCEEHINEGKVYIILEISQDKWALYVDKKTKLKNVINYFKNFFSI